MRLHAGTHMRTATARGKAAEHLCLFQDLKCFPTLTASDQELNQKGKTHLFTRAKEYAHDDVLKIALNTFSQSAGASHSLACT